MPEKKFFTYILLTVNNKLYCGYTDNLGKRFNTHLVGTASKFTRANKPVKYVYINSHSTKQEAMREENKIKRLSRKKKEELCIAGL
jgi:putative endonuclease